MRQSIYLLILMITALITGCTGSSDTQGTAGQTIDAGYDQTMRQADSLYNCMQFRDAYKLYLQLLDNEETKADSEKRLNVLDALCNTSELSDHKPEQHKWLQQMVNLAKQTGNNYYQSMACITMGQNLFYEGDREKGIYYVNEAIRLMEKTDRENTDHLIHGYLNMLASMYSAKKDYDNALKTNKRNLQLTIDGTRWGVDSTQQLIDRRMALAKMASLQAQMGNFKQADSAYSAWKAIEYEGNHTRDYFIVDYMKKRGRYLEAIPIYENLIERVRQQGDTLGEMMNAAKWGLAEVYRKMGHCNQAANLYEQVLEIQDTLKSRKARNSAQELAAIYHENEQEQTIMQQQAENTRQRYLLFGALIVLVGVMSFSVIIIRKNRIISRKNQSLAAQITEAMAYKEKYMQEKSEKTPSPTDTPSPDSLSDDQLFNYINDIIVRERLFLDSHFDRQTIMDRFNLSKERVGAAFSKGSQYAKLTDYTQELRLEYSTLLMSNNPEKSVSQIAAECGFASYAYFSRCFRQRFGMTPTEFRTSSSQEA